MKEIVRRALEPGEIVRYATSGWRYSFAESYFSGGFARYQNQTTFVLTDRRLLLLATDRKGRPRDIKNQIALADVTEVRKRIDLRLRDGTTAKLRSVPRADQTALLALLASRPTGDGIAAGSAEHASLVHLCPRCLRAVPGRAGEHAACPHLDCRIAYRSPTRAAAMSALIPGVGDLYLRHHVLGTAEFLGSVAVLALVSIAALDSWFADGRDGPVVAILLAFGIGVPRLIDYFLTLHMGRKGLVPLASAPAGSPTDSLPSFPAWVYGLFAVTAVGGVWFLTSQIPIAKETAIVWRAVDLANGGRVAEAWAAFDGADRDQVRDEAVAQLVLAMLEQGDADGIAARERELHFDFAEPDTVERIDRLLEGRTNAAAGENAAPTGE